MTDRLLQAMACRWVDVLAHPTGRLILKREPYRFDADRVFAAASAAGVAIEINSQIDRLDLSDVNARLARERGVKLVISSDAHSTSALSWTRWGVLMARRAWAAPSDILNTLPFEQFTRALRRHANG